MSITKLRVCDDHKEGVIAHKVWRLMSSMPLGMPNTMKHYYSVHQIIAVADPGDCQMCKYPEMFMRDK